MATLNKSLAARSASPYAFGFVGAALMVSSYLMQSMLPLRIVALLACLCLAVYGYLGAALPTVLLYGALIPINIKKTWQIHQLVRAIEHARSDTPVSQCLLAHLTRRSATAGQVLWRKGDMATWRHGDRNALSGIRQPAPDRARQLAWRWQPGRRERLVRARQPPHPDA